MCSDQTLNSGNRDGEHFDQHPTVGFTSGAFVQSLTTLDLTTGQNPGSGNGGNVTVQGLQGAGSPATTVSLDNSTISTQIFGGNAATPPGAITITAQAVNLGEGASIQTDTFGAAPAGDITLNVDMLHLIGNPIFQTKISSDSFLPNFEAGKAGDITIQGVKGPDSSATRVFLDGGTVFPTSRPAACSSPPRPRDLARTPYPQYYDHRKNIGHRQFCATSDGYDRRGPGWRHHSQRGHGGPGGGPADRRPIILLNHQRERLFGKTGNITIQGLTGDGSPALHVTLDGAIITTATSGFSADVLSGNITITAKTLDASTTVIGTTSSSVTPAGDTTVNVDTLEARHSSLFSDNFGGKTGSITIQGSWAMGVRRYT
jgi:hypothetical protein